jgi:lipoprotein-anchoring transpeptidase ErfK/SrfK
VTRLGYGQDVGSTYIEISLKQQHMWFYYNGKLYCETDVVTGNDDGYHNTPKGTYRIWQRMSPATLVGADYSCPVDYWLAFTYQGHGIHDSSWRSSGEYGGTTYKGNGSHGCVNTPHKAVKKIYSKAKIGCEVVIY